MFKRIDEDLLSLYERLSRKIQVLTGMNCFKQGLVSSFFSSVAMICLVLPITFDKSVGLSGKLILLSAPFLLQFSAYSSYRNTERKAEESSQGNLRNRNYLNWYHARIAGQGLLLAYFLVALAVGSFGRRDIPLDIATFKVLLMVLGFSLINFLYLLSCTPLPPRKSKIRKFLESFAESQKTAENESA